MASAQGFIDASGMDNAVVLTIELGSGRVLFKLTIHNDCTWQMTYKDTLLGMNMSHLRGLPQRLNFPDVRYLFSLMTEDVCCGQSDFPILVAKTVPESRREQLLYSRDHKTVTGFVQDNTIRHISFINEDLRE